MFERFDFVDDGQYFRVVVVKVGRWRLASYSNRVGFSLWKVRGTCKKTEKKIAAPIAFGRLASYN